METRIENLELKLMDTELSVEKLNQVIIDQQTTIERLVQRLERLETMTSNAEPAVVSSKPEPPPPHY